MTNSETASKKALRIAVCVGGTNTRIAALTPSFEILKSSVLETDAGGDLMRESKLAVDRKAFTLEHWDRFVPLRARLLDQIGDALRREIQEVLDRGERVKGIGISAPGAIHPLTGFVRGKFGAHNLPAWGEFNLRDEIARRTRCPVRAINDAKAMALGSLTCMETHTVEWLPEGKDGALCEKALGEAGRRVRDFVELDPGTGLGGAYVKDGRIWFGPDEDDPDPDVGELWKLNITPEVFGSNLEEQASGRSTLRRVETRIREQAGGGADSVLSRAAGRIQDLLAEAPTEWRDWIDEELRRTGRYLGMGIRLILGEERKRLTAPDFRTFVIGGGPVSGDRAESAHVRLQVFRGITEITGEISPPVRILFTKLGGKAGVYGSAALIAS